MINPVTELIAFGRAALVEPVARDHRASEAVQKRRRRVTLATLVVGAGCLAWALRVPAGDGLFYVGTLALAAVWAVGALLSGPLHLGHAHRRSGTGPSRAIVQSLALGVVLLAVFLLGALVVAHVPVLRGPVERLLDHARFGSIPLVVVVTAVNGVAEELYFRGALYAALGRRHAVAISAGLYTAVTAAAGIPLLIVAGLVLGVVTGLQRRVTGGVLGPIVTHLTWSLGMLFLLPVALSSVPPAG